MEKNEGIPKNYLNTLQYKQTSNILCIEVTERLNAASPPEKSVDGWKKVSKDFKYNTKNKIKINKKSINGTGGGPCRVKRQTNFEERVSKLLDLQGEVQKNNVSRFGCIVEPTAHPDTSHGNSITTHLDVELELPSVPSTSNQTNNENNGSNKENHSGPSTVPDGNTIGNGPRRRSDMDLIRLLNDTLKFNKQKWETKQIWLAEQTNSENDRYQAQQRVLVEQTKQKCEELKLKRQELDHREREF